MMRNSVLEELRVRRFADIVFLFVILLYFVLHFGCFIYWD